MTRWADIRRAWIACIAIYALVAHSLLLAMARMPLAPADGDLRAALQVICAPGTGADAPAPADHHQHHVACALCGVGHCSLALPSDGACIPQAPYLCGPVIFSFALDPPTIISVRTSHRARAPPPFH